MDNSEIKIEKETDKICIHCNHYKGFRWTAALDDDTGSCAFRTLRTNRKESQCMKDLERMERCPVTGTIRYFFKHKDALAVRNDEAACGLEGKWFEEYNEPERKYSDPIKPAKKPQISVDDLI